MRKEYLNLLRHEDNLDERVRICTEYLTKNGDDREFRFHLGDSYCRLGFDENGTVSDLSLLEKGLQEFEKSSVWPQGEVDTAAQYGNKIAKILAQESKSTKDKLKYLQSKLVWGEKWSKRWQIEIYYNQGDFEMAGKTAMRIRKDFKTQFEKRDYISLAHFFKDKMINKDYAEIYKALIISHLYNDNNNDDNKNKDFNKVVDITAYLLNQGISLKETIKAFEDTLTFPFETVLTWFKTDKQTETIPEDLIKHPLMDTLYNLYCKALDTGEQAIKRKDWDTAEKYLKTVKGGLVKNSGNELLTDKIATIYAEYKGDELLLIAKFMQSHIDFMKFDEVLEEDCWKNHSSKTCHFIYAVGQARSNFDGIPPLSSEENRIAYFGFDPLKIKTRDYILKELINTVKGLSQ